MTHTEHQAGGRASAPSPHSTRVRRRRSRGVALFAAAVTAMAGLPAIASQAAIDAAPLIHYTFDQAASGSTITDVSGNGYNATLRQTGAQVQNGALELPGGARSTSAYVEIPTTGLVGKTDLTFSTWIANRTANGNVAAAFVGAPVASGASYSSGYWLLNPANPSGYVKSVITNTTNAGAPWGTEVGPGATNTATTGARTPAGMSLYTTVIDGTTGQLRVYVNGTQINQTAISRNVSSFGAQLVSYLGRSTYNDPHWGGLVDDFAVYGQALSAADVKTLYTERALGFAAAAIQVPEQSAANFPLVTSTSGVQVTWESDNAAVRVENGTAVVTRPAAGQGDATVTLTATLNDGTSSETRQYVVVVPQQLSDEQKVAQDLQALEVRNADDVRTNFSVATSAANGSTIEWTVAESGAAYATVQPGVRADSRTIAIERPAAGEQPVEVVLTATARSGAVTATREFTLRIQPLQAATGDPEAYVWAFFTGEGAGAERISLAASQGNDVLSWNALNDGEPIFASTEGTQGLRDPFIIRAPEGDKFYMLATDLKVAGLPGGFTTAQISGSRHIEVWESTDLVNWSEQRHVKVSTDYAGNTWAPEAYWDESIGKFVVFWASNLYPTTDASQRTAVTYNRMMYATTDDFVTFSEPQVWIDVRRGTGRGMIDSTVTELDGVYHRFTKDEASMTIRQEKSTNLLDTHAGTTLPGTTGPADEWTLVKERIASGLPNGEPGGVFSSGEGANIIKSNPGDVNGFDWYLFIDQPDYHGGPNHYVPFGSNDLNDGNSWQPLGQELRDSLPQNSDGGKPRHGTVIPVTRAEYQTVLEGWQPDIAVESVAPMEVTTEVGVAPQLPQAELTMVEGPEQTVDVDWEEVDPADYASAGTFTVRGVAQDASRMPVEATVTVEEPSGIQVSVDTRCVAGKGAISVRVSNVTSAPIQAVIATPLGSKTVTVPADKAASYAFTSRTATLAAGTVTVTPTGGPPVEADYAARSC